MGNKTGSLELLDPNVTLYSVTYPTAAEVAVEIPYTNQTVDLGTISLATDDESAEFAVYFVDSTGTAANGKVWISNHMPGIKFVTDTSLAALTASLEVAGTPASYSTSYGYYSNAASVAISTGESNRIRFQLQGNATEYGTLPYDPTKDNVKYAANMYLYWNSSDYVKRFDMMQGRAASDGLVEINNVELFMHETYNGVETSISLGDIRDTVSLERVAEFVELQKGFIKRRVKKTQTSTNYTIMANLEVRDPATMERFMRHDLSYDSTKKHWVQTKNDKPDLLKRKFSMYAYTVDNTLIVMEFPEAEIVAQGTMEYGGENYTLPLEISILPDSNGEYGSTYTSPNSAYITLLGLKYAITV